MERNRMEADFREKLNQREITPTNHAWDRLDAMLTAEEQKKPKSNYNWLFIAAGFVGLLLVATLFFKNSSPNDNIQNEVVIENRKIEETPKDTEISQPLSPKVTTETQLVLETENPIKVKQRSSTKKYVAQEAIAAQDQVADNKPSSSQKIDVPNNIPTNVIAVADVQINKLLDNIDSSSKNASDKKVIKIDANALLSQVDGELERSFRERALHVFNKNYKSVKLALSTRNQE